MNGRARVVGASRFNPPSPSRHIRGWSKCWYSSKTAKPIKQVIYPSWMVFTDECEIENQLARKLPDGWVYKLKRNPSKEDLSDFYVFEEFKKIETYNIEDDE